MQEHLTSAEKLALATSPYPSNAALFADCLLACLDAVLGDTEVRTRADFERVRDAASATVVDALFDTVGRVSAVLGKARAADRAIRDATSMSLVAPLADARSQLGTLVFPGFVALTGVAQLRRLPVYLDGLIHRVGKLADNAGRDRVWQNEVQIATGRYLEAGGTLPLAPGTAREPRTRPLDARGAAAVVVRAAHPDRRVGVAAAHHEGAGGLSRSGGTITT